MLRCLVRQIQHALTLQPIPTTLLSKANSSRIFAQTCLQSRSIFHNCYEKQANTDIVSEEAARKTAVLEADTAYIKPYNFDNETPIQKNTLIEALRTRFRLTGRDVENILNDEVVTRKYKTPLVLHTLDILCLEGVNKKSFIDYPWLLTLERTRLQQKLALLHTMRIRDINHFVGLLRLSVARLRKLVNSLNREGDTVPQGNRIYYISERLETDPYIVTKFLSRRLFILEMPFDMFKQNLEHMISYKVSSKNILRDLWAFRYTPKSVQVRLERARRAKKDKIMPWMVRCPETILERSLQLSMDELAVLGDKTSAVEYVAERLQFQVEQTKAIMEKHPLVFRVRVTKIKDVLDYLLNEAGFSRYEIAQVPRILCHSLETTKKRLDELKSYGCRPTSLVIVCRSKREYEKFIQYWLSMQKDYTKKADSEKTQNVAEPAKT